MQYFLILLSMIVSGLTCFAVLKYEKSYNFIIETTIASVLAGIFQFFVVIWLLPTVGFFYPGTWISLMFATLIGATIPLLFNNGSVGYVVPLIIVCLLIVFYFFSSSELLYSKRYRSLLGEVKIENFTETLTPVDPKKIRLVPKKTAQILANKVLGQSQDGTILGSQLHIDTSSAAIQEVNGELWWIFPLDFSGFFRWQSRKVVPGYIRVNAQDPTREAELITSDPITKEKFKLIYTRDAYFGSWIDRKVYNRFPTICNEDFTFEVDNNWRPYYIISATSPEIGFSGYTTKGVIIADPQTGEISFKSGRDIPYWIDRIIPHDQAMDQIVWWGEYIHGWFNSVFNKKDIQTTTIDDLWFIEHEKVKYWFTGMTSVSSKDQSLVGIIMVNTRSGYSIYLPAHGTDENGVLQTVDAALGADSNRWSPAQPIPYNIFGTPTWVLPVISNEGIFQKVALVDINNINNIAIERNLDFALEKYRTLLSQNINKHDIKKDFSGLSSIGPVKVIRIGDTVIGGNKTFYLLIDGYKNVLFTTTGESNSTKLVTIVKQGDLVTIKFLQSNSTIIPIESLSIKGIKLK